MILKRTKHQKTILLGSMALIFTLSVPTIASADSRESILTCIPSENFYALPVSGEVAKPSLRTDNTNFEDYLVSQLQARIPTIDIASYGYLYSDVGPEFLSILSRHPELYFVKKSIRTTYNSSTGTALSLIITYLPQEDGVDEKIESETEKVLALIRDDMSPLEKIITIHDYLCIDIEYAHQDYLNQTVPDAAHTLKGALVDKIAVCDGYSGAFQYYMNLLDIPCKVVTGEGNGGAHAWNQVQVGNNWYMLDVTWDDPVWDNYGNVDHSHFLKSDENFTGHEWTVSDYEPCTDDSYESAFWNDTQTRMIFHNKEWYYIDSNGNLNKHSFTEDAITSPGEKVTEIGGTWHLYGDASQVYIGNFAKLTEKDGMLYYSQPSGIYTCNFDGSSKRQIFEADTSDGYIYGMKLVDNKVLYQIAQEPYAKERTVHSFTLVPLQPLENADILLSADSFIYTEVQQFPSVTVTLNGKTLSEGTDYDISYSYPGNGIGTVTLTVTGKGKYEGTKNAFYKIEKAPQSLRIPETNIQKTFGDAPFNLNVSAVGTVHYTSENTNVAMVDNSGNVTVTGAGTAVIRIEASETEQFHSGTGTVTITVSEKSGNEKPPVETEKPVEPEKPSDENKKPSAGNEKPPVETEKPVEPEKPSAGNEKPSGGNEKLSGESEKTSISAPAKVTKVSVKSKAARKLLVKWKKQNCDGYRIQISQKSNFRKIVKTVTLRGQKKVKRTISGLNSKKKYYVRVQAYKLENGKKIYGTFSKKVKVRVK